MKKILIVIAILFATVAFGRHMPVSPDSPDDSSPNYKDDKELRKELDEMLVQEINSVEKKENIDNTGEYSFSYCQQFSLSSN